MSKEDPQRLGLDESCKATNDWWKKNPYPIKKVGITNSLVSQGNLECGNDTALKQ